MLWIFYIVFFVIELIAIASAVHALFTVRTTQGTIAWVIGLVCLPWLALPMYWMFGSRRFDAYSSAMKQKLTEHHSKVHEVRQEMERFQVPRSEITPDGVGDLTAVADDHFMLGNKLDLLIDGEATFDAIIEEIGKAEKCVFVQFYIMRPDGLGTRLLEALAAKAQSGVDVCFLVDSLGSAAMKPDIIQQWRDRGIRLGTFCAYSKWRDRWRLNFRNHRKNIIIDGRIGFVGGHNVGDEYLGLDPKYGRWRDTHVRVEGPVALQLQMVFAADWFFATREPLKGCWDADMPSVGGHSRALVLASGPSDEEERCTLFFLNVITMAKRRLWIASPYFVPDEGILQALQLAAIRGVEVRLLLPKRPDEPLVWLASLAMMTELTHPNVHVHRYNGGFLHQKVLLVDEDFAAVGTANFDNRSFRLNFEITLAVSNLDFTTQVAAMLEKDFAESLEVGSNDYATKPFYIKAGAQAARLLAPIL